MLALSEGLLALALRLSTWLQATWHIFDAGMLLGPLHQAWSAPTDFQRFRALNIKSNALAKIGLQQCLHACVYKHVHGNAVAADLLREGCDPRHTDCECGSRSF